ncbi:MAG: hypothetical protein MJ252_26645, partial [archaeon]|nr:hypothetical protein [archaeon]
MQLFFTLCLILFGLKVIRKKIFTNKSIMIIFGSGGHTGELILMLKKLDFNKFSDCYFISAHSDKNSEIKVKENFNLDKFTKTKFHFIKIYRSRSVGQKTLSSIFTTLYALLQSFFILLKTRPSIAVSNGPGTAIPILFMGYFLRKVMILSEFKILFIESYCRTNYISRSGKLVEFIADKFIVLWEKLKGGNK